MLAPVGGHKCHMPKLDLGHTEFVLPTTYLLMSTIRPCPASLSSASNSFFSLHLPPLPTRLLATEQPRVWAAIDVNGPAYARFLSSEESLYACPISE